VSERSPHASTNGRAHILALGCAAALPGEVRAQIAAEGSVEWVADIYGAAAQTRNRQHGYRALLLDLRALSRQQLDFAIALAARTGLVVWLLPLDAGRTRMDAALSAGAIPWPRVVEPIDTRQVPSAPVEVKPPPAAKVPLQSDIAARLSEVLLGGAMKTVPNARVAPAVLPAAIPTNGHDQKAAPLPERQAQTARGEEVLSAAPVPVAPAVRSPEPKPAPLPTSEAAPAGPPKESLLDLAARFSQAAPPRSENVATPDITKVQVTSTPPPEYDEMSPVLSEDELRALLGPPE
jgi:hypothetical protein